MTSTPTGIGRLSLVCLPTPDQDGAIAFYEKLGFEKRTDAPFDGRYRWIEVYPPEGETGIALAPPPPDEELVPMLTGIIVTTSDVTATHAAMRSLGVEVDAEVLRMGDVCRLCSGSDPTGHTLMMVEQR